MALRGTLADLGIIDLIQFPHAGRKTGLLIISSQGREAKLYYDKGALSHAAADDATGMEALVRIVDWTEGDFEFEAAAVNMVKTIDLDLHRAVMQALKLHDELKEAQMRRKTEIPVPAPVVKAPPPAQSKPPEPVAVVRESPHSPSPAAATDIELSARLGEFIASNSHAKHASVLAESGALKADANSPEGEPGRLNELRDALYTFTREYPRPGLNRVFLVDAAGTVVITKIPGGDALLVVSGKEASLGAVTMSVGRFAIGLH